MHVVRRVDGHVRFRSAVSGQRCMRPARSCVKFSLAGVEGSTDLDNWNCPTSGCSYSSQHNEQQRAGRSGRVIQWSHDLFSSMLAPRCIGECRDRSSWVRHRHPSERSSGERSCGPVPAIPADSGPADPTVTPHWKAGHTTSAITSIVVKTRCRRKGSMVRDPRGCQATQRSNSRWRYGQINAPL